MLQGCSLTSSVDLASARSNVETIDTKLAQAKSLEVSISAQLEEAKKIAEATHDANAIKAVSVLSSALATASQTVPHLQEASANAKQALAQLQEQGDTAPVWKVLMSLGLLFVPKALAFVPGVGPIAEPIARAVGSIVWAAVGSKSHKEEDKGNEMAAQALEVQVKFANDLLKGVPVDKAKDTARASLEEAGIYAPVKSLVRAVEKG